MDGKPEIRIGDDDRRRTDARLRSALDEGRITLGEYEERAALVWAARTGGDLAAVVDDLPPVEAAPVAAPVTAPPKGALVLRRIGTALGTVVAVGALGFGVVSVVGADDGSAIFSSRPVQVGAGQDQVELGVLFGNIEVVVPDGVAVRPVARMIFGNVDCDTACLPAAPGARQVVVDATGAFGNVTILTQTEAAAQPDRDRDRGGRGDRDDDD